MSEGPRRFAGKAAVITGASRGIGRAIAERLASEGAAVVLSGRSLEAGEQAVRAVRDAGGEALFIPADLTRPDGAAGLIDEAVAAFGRLDIVVNNAAPTDIITSMDDTVADIRPEAWDHIIRGATTAALLVSQAVIPHLRGSPAGAIVNISTSVATRGFAGMVGHSASKAAIEALTRSLAVELGADGIRANSVVLGFIVSGERQAAVAVDPVRGAAIKSMQLLRFGRSEDVAAAVAFLASEEAGFITGISLPVDGGSSCRMPLASLPTLARPEI